MHVVNLPIPQHPYCVVARRGKGGKNFSQSFVTQAGGEKKGGEGKPVRSYLFSLSPAIRPIEEKRGGKKRKKGKSTFRFRVENKRTRKEKKRLTGVSTFQ